MKLSFSMTNSSLKILALEPAPHYLKEGGGVDEGAISAESHDKVYLISQVVCLPVELGQVGHAFGGQVQLI